MTNFRSIASIYNPDLLTKDQLIDNYVVRLKKFDKLFADIKTADMEKPEQHLMLVGLRGMGKTTLLRRLAYEVENDPGLNSWLVPIIFNEEEYGINQLFKLWETIAKYLEKRDVAFAGLFNEMDQIYTRLKDDVHRYEQEVFELLLERLHQYQKKLLLFIDNFGDMFKRFTKKNEKQRLREILMTCPDLRIIAASAVVMEAFFKYDDPLYEFFKIERLEGLDFEETKTLLLKLGAHIPDNPIQKIIDEQPQRIEALRRLTGGIPRSMVLFFDIFIKDKDGTALTDLEKILDYVTPLYKQRMDDLPSQQQDIMQTLALNYDGMSAREIADRTRLSSKLVSAQLNQLQKDNLVSVANEGSKNHIYHVYDRFFNIWFLMRMARSGDKNRILWLVRFLEAWCTPEDLAKRSEAHRDAMAMTFYDPRAAYTFSSALYYADNQDIDKRYLMARRTQDYLRYSAPDLFEQSKTSDLGFFGRGVTAMKLHNWEEAYQELVGIKEKNMQDYLLLYVLEEIKENKQAAESWLNKAKNLNKSALCLEVLIGEIFSTYVQDRSRAKEYYAKAVAEGDVKACCQLGHIKRYEKSFSEAEDYYNLGKSRESKDASYFLGLMYWHDFNDYDKAEELLLESVLVYKKDGALLQLGDMFFYIRDYDQAINYYQKAAEKGLSSAWVRLGGLYIRNRQFKEGIDAYIKAGNLGESSGWIELGNWYSLNKETWPKAISCYEKLTNAGHIYGFVKLGNIYRDKYQIFPKAEDFYHKAISLGDSDAWFDLGRLYEVAYNDNDKAIECYLNAANGGDGLYYGEVGRVHGKIQNFKEALHYYHKTLEFDNPWVWHLIAKIYEEIHDFKNAEKAYLNLHLIDENAAFAKEFLIEFYLRNVNRAEYREYCLEKILGIEMPLGALSKYLVNLLSISQYHFVYKYFNSERGQSLQLKDHLLPIYYALMHYLKDEYPQEYLRTPPELKETVQEIMDKVEEYRIAYQLPQEEATPE